MAKKTSKKVKTEVIEESVSDVDSKVETIDVEVTNSESSEPEVVTAEQDVLDDDQIKPADEPEPEEEPIVIANDEPRQSGFMPLVLGGVLAAVVGFIGARADVLDNFLPPAWRLDAGQRDLNEKLDAAQSEIVTLNQKLADVSQDIANRPTADQSGNDDLVAALAALSDRITSLEDRPTSGPVSVPDFSDDFAQLQSIAAKQQAEIDALLADAKLATETSQDAAQNTLARAAATRIVAAVESGAPFAAALGDLETAGVTDVPSALSDAAENGVITLAALQQSIPDAARAALAASPTDENAGIGGFLKRQLGARSVAPKEGSDPDAILSRVEGAVRNGHLTDALAEVETLPQESKSAMSDWLEQANDRLAVTTASELLMQRLAAN